MEARKKANPKSDFCWRWSKELYKFGLKEGFVVLKNNRIYTKTYKNAEIKKNKKGYYIEIIERKKPTTTLEFIENKYSNDNAKKDISKHFDEKVFEYSKPISLIYKIAKISTTSNDVILDFFAGSGTTGDSVMQLNAEDGGNRKYILVQLPETIDPKKNKAAYDFVKNELQVAEPTIFEITKERLLRAAEKIKNDTIHAKIARQEVEIKALNGKLDLENKQEQIATLQASINALREQDLGFKIFETTPIWDDYDFEANQMNTQTELFDETKLTPEDINALLVTWKTYDNIPLTQNLQPIDLGGYTAYYGKGKLYLMQKGFTTDNLKNLLEKLNADPGFEPRTIIAFGYHFESKSLRELAENTKSFGNKKKTDIDFITRY